MKNSFLLEIGTEEIPSFYLPALIKQLKDRAEQIFSEAQLSFQNIRTYVTPRRLVLFIDELADQQKDITVEVTGPPIQIAFQDPEHLSQPTKAALGFAKAQGIQVEDLEVKETPKGKMILARRHQKGLSTNEILKDLLPKYISALSFPKFMRWGANPARFVRPIRWLLALFGEEIISFEFAGVQSGRISQGHRWLGSAQISIPVPAQYFDLLAKNGVIVDSELRKESIITQIAKEISKINGKVREDPELLETVTFLVEQPQVILGEFDPQFLELPAEVIIESMRTHEHFFAVENVNQDNSLTNYFILVANNNINIENIRKGAERVLRARLADAKFFFDEDLKRSLKSYQEALQGMAFAEGLGSLWEKIQRVKFLANTILVELEDIYGSEFLNDDEKKSLSEAAEIYKSDLCTQMVSEFPALQGFMGKIYATKEGFSDSVSEAIFEHYLPRFENDQLPQTKVGAVLALADKLDTLAACFGKGLIPTGSKDPLALRRAATGFVQIILDKKWLLGLKPILDTAINSLEKANLTTIPHEEIFKSVQDFLEQRFIYLQNSAGYRQDFIEAILNAEGSSENRNFVQDAEKLKTLQEFYNINREDFKALIIIAKRVARIIPLHHQHAHKEYKISIYELIYRNVTEKIKELQNLSASSLEIQKKVVMEKTKESQDFSASYLEVQRIVREKMREIQNFNAIYPEVQRIVREKIREIQNFSTAFPEIYRRMNELVKKSIEDSSNKLRQMQEIQKRVYDEIQKIMISKNLFKEEAEKILWQNVSPEKENNIGNYIRKCYEKNDYFGVLQSLCTLGPDIDRYYDEVMVMAEDQNLQTNRLEELLIIKDLFWQFDDFSKIVSD